MDQSGGCGPSCLRRSGPGRVQYCGRGGWCTLRYWNRRVRNCIKTCISSGEANNVAEQPAAQASLHANEAKDKSLPEITVADVDTLLQHVEAEIQRLSPSSTSSSLVLDTISHWEERKQSIATFMKSLPDQVVKVVDSSTNVLINLLIKGLGGTGQVHWIGLGLSFMAWSLENINRTTQNYEEGLEVLQQSVRLLKSTKQIWEYIRTKGGSKSYERDLQENIERAFRCAIICTSNLNDNRILRCINTLVESLALVVLFFGIFKVLF